MRKRTIAGTIALAMSASAAHAQNSVTLYGIIDTGIAYIHNSGGQSSQWRMQTSNINGTQWGLKGAEDLGGGLSAVFTLENGFDSGNGQLGFGGREFGRQAYVGLSSATAGTVTFGRQYDPLTGLLQPLTADVFGGWFVTPGDVDNYDDSARFSNSVKWVSPTWGGVTVEGLYALGGVAGASGSGKAGARRHRTSERAAFCISTTEIRRRWRAARDGRYALQLARERRLCVCAQHQYRPRRRQCRVRSVHARCGIQLFAL